MQLAAATINNRMAYLYIIKSMPQPTKIKNKSSYKQFEHPDIHK
jgi:hypothetical protein